MYALKHVSYSKWFILAIKVNLKASMLLVSMVSLTALLSVLRSAWP